MNSFFLVIRRCYIAFAILLPSYSQAQVAAHDTLDVVNWNLEFFGDRYWELPEEMIKTKAIMDSLDADIYALVEIVNTDSLHSLVQSLNGNYNYIVSPYGSFAPTPSSSQYDEAQKLAFVYRKSMVKNVSGRALLKNSLYAYDYWASGRFPFLVTAEVLGKDNQWRSFHFVIIHAKANSDYNSCNRRYAGALELKDTLDKHFADARIIMLGDYNDDLDISICPSYTASTYAAFVNDSFDANAYKALTLPLSMNGISTIAGYPSFIDHVIVSNEVAPYYVNGSAEVLKNKVEQWVSAYTSDVSDHYPVRTKYVMNEATKTEDVLNEQGVVIYPVPASNILFISQHTNNFTAYAVFSADGKKISEGKLDRITTSIMLKNYSAGIYFIRLSGNSDLHTQQFIIVK